MLTVSLVPVPPYHNYCANHHFVHITNTTQPQPISKKMPSKSDEFTMGNSVLPLTYTEATASVPQSHAVPASGGPTNGAPPPIDEKRELPNYHQGGPQHAAPSVLQKPYPDIKIHADSWRDDPPLCHAVSRGDEGLVRLLISKGADVNGKTYFGKPALYHAAINGSWRIMEVLIEAGASVDAREMGGRTTMHLVAEKRNLEMLKLLLDHGANVNARPSAGETALYAAAGRGNTETMHVLLQHGADTNETPFAYNSALYHAVSSRNEAVVNLLLASNVNVDFT